MSALVMFEVGCVLGLLHVLHAVFVLMDIGQRTGKLTMRIFFPLKEYVIWISLTHSPVRRPAPLVVRAFL